MPSALYHTAVCSSLAGNDIPASRGLHWFNSDIFSFLALSLLIFCVLGVHEAGSVIILAIDHRGSGASAGKTRL